VGRLCTALLFHALGQPLIEQGLPLTGFLFPIALGVDYTIVLMTRAREEVAQLGHARRLTGARSHRRGDHQR
jgi:RND superfamily putative drug exporter